MIRASNILDDHVKKTGIFIWCPKYEQRHDIILCFFKECHRTRLGKAQCPEFVKGLERLKPLYRKEKETE